MPENSNNIYSIAYNPQKTKAVLTIDPTPGNEPSVNDVMEYLSSEGIKVGIIESAVSEIISKMKWGKPVLIAQAIEPQNGEDASIKMFFDAEPSFIPERREDGSVDFFNIKSAIQVLKNDPLAEKTPLTLGTPGKNIFGNTIVGIPGKDKDINNGVNTVFEDEENTRLIAEVDGHVSLGSIGQIMVMKEFVVKNDVDFSTGNLDFNGDIKVNGIVKSGFQVKASGNVEVFGVVEDGSIYAGGDVILRRGYMGGGKGEIKAGQDVIMKFVRNQKVFSGRDIVISESSVNAYLSAERAIRVEKSKGKIIGGIAIAKKILSAQQIGNENKITTRVMAGQPIGETAEIKNLDKEIASAQENIDKMEPAIQNLRKKARANILPQEAQLSLKQLEYTFQIILTTIKDLQKKRKQLLDVDGTIAAGMYLKVIGKAFTGSTITVGGISKKLNETIGPRIFRLGMGELKEERIFSK